MLPIHSGLQQRINIIKLQSLYMMTSNKYNLIKKDIFISVMLSDKYSVGSVQCYCT